MFITSSSLSACSVFQGNDVLVPEDVWSGRRGSRSISFHSRRNSRRGGLDGSPGSAMSVYSFSA